MVVSKKIRTLADRARAELQKVRAAKAQAWKGVPSPPGVGICRLEGCSSEVEPGVGQKTGRPRLACSKAYYKQHKRRELARQELTRA